MDSKEGNRALGTALFSEQDRRRGEIAPELTTADYSARIGSNPPMNREGHSGFGRAFYAAFPDMHHQIDQVIADDNVAVVRFTLQGTHSQPFFGIPASNRKVAVPAQVILTIHGGRVASLVGVFDEAGLLRQIGALPAG